VALPKLPQKIGINGFWVPDIEEDVMRLRKMPIRLNRMKDEEGFTLLELMVVIAIIGILASIAIPQYAALKTRSYNSAAESDLKNATTAQEAYFVDEQTYSAAVSNITGASYGLYLCQGVTVSAVSANASTYQMTSSHSLGDKTWTIIGPGGSITG